MEYNDEFGRAVRNRMAEKRVSTRGLEMASRGKISRSSISLMRMSKVPGIDLIIAFAEAIGDDPNEWLELVGSEYRVVDPVDLIARLESAADPIDEVRRIFRVNIPSPVPADNERDDRQAEKNSPALQVNHYYSCFQAPGYLIYKQAPGMPSSLPS